MKIVYLDAYTLHPDEVDLSVFDSLGDYVAYDRTSRDLILERAKDAEVVLTNKVAIDREILMQLPSLKYIGITATGYNIVDIKAANDLGIIVSNARNYSSNSVAQQTFAMMLSFTNRLAEHNDFGRWSSQPDFCYYDYSITELAGKTIGLIGFGNIAQKVAQIALAFDMKVLVNKLRPLENPIFNLEVVDLDTLFTESDFVSLHCPQTMDNLGFMNQTAFKKMKKSAYLINTARGGLINETDLCHALNAGEIAGAYLDVLGIEPPDLGHVLTNARNLKVSPHIAWASLEARQKLIEIVFNNLQSFLSGNPKNALKA